MSLVNEIVATRARMTPCIDRFVNMTPHHLAFVSQDPHASCVKVLAPSGCVLRAKVGASEVIGTVPSLFAEGDGTAIPASVIVHSLPLYEGIAVAGAPSIDRTRDAGILVSRRVGETFEQFYRAGRIDELRAQLGLEAGSEELAVYSPDSTSRRPLPDGSLACTAVIAFDVVF